MRALFLGLVLLVGASGPGFASIRIVASPGGVIGQYVRMFALVRQSGEDVIIDGPCYSACTLVLSIVPKERICVTRKAILGFHAAWLPGRDGRPLTAVAATKIMYQTYPGPVRRWISKRGGLTRKPIMLRGRELAAMYPQCA